MSAYVDLSDAQVRRILRKHLNNIDSVKDLESIVKLVLKEAHKWKGFDWSVVDNILSKKSKPKKSDKASSYE